MNRRQLFLGAGATLLTAPALVRAASLDYVPRARVIEPSPMIISIKSYDGTILARGTINPDDRGNGITLQHLASGQAFEYEIEGGTRELRFAQAARLLNLT